MTSRDYLGYLTLSQFMASAMNPIQDALGRLSHDVLLYVVLITYLVLFVALVCRGQTKGQAPYSVGTMEVPPWLPVCIFCVLATLMLL